MRSNKLVTSNLYLLKGNHYIEITNIKKKETWSEITSKANAREQKLKLEIGASTALQKERVKVGGAPFHSHHKQRKT